MNELINNFKQLAEELRLFNIVVKSCFEQKLHPDFQTHKNFVMR